MTVELDNAYRVQRLRLAGTVTALAAAEWARAFRDRDEALTTVPALVDAGMAQTVALVSGYMTLKARSEGVDVETRGLDVSRYTIAALRRKPADLVYGRVFGAVGGQLEQGAEFESALASGRASLERLVATDMQLAQTHAARDWMGDEERVYGYRRVLGPGKNCSLCVKASTRLYYREDLMPIHERCRCSVSPLFREQPGGLSAPSAAVRVADDDELGARLLEESWAA